MTDCDPARDATIVMLWQKWQRLRAEEDAAWKADDDPEAEERQRDIKAALDELSSLIVSLRPRSVVGLLVQLRVLSPLLCPTPSDQLEYADLEERWFRSILSGAEALARGALPPWDPDEDGTRADAPR